MRLIFGTFLLVACAPVRPPQAPTYTPAELVERSKGSIVHVVTDHDDGSGFVVAKGRVATSRSIVANAGRIQVVLPDGTTRGVTGVWLAENDLGAAILAVDTTGLKLMALADSGTLKKGDAVASLGHGGALAVGTVAAPGEIPTGPAHAELSHAIMGGPVVNRHGESIGVHVRAEPRGGFRVTVANQLVPLAHAATPAQPISVLGRAPRASEAAGGHATDCEAGKLDACAQYRAEEPEKARALLVKACNDGSGAACTLAARMTGGGEGGPANPARAQALFELACERGEADACAEMPKPKQPRRKR